MKFPAECHLLGHHIQIHAIPESEWEHGPGVVGVWLPSKNRIELLQQGESAMLHALCHEWTHAILGMMNHRLYSNEAFVDQFGGMLAQMLSTLKEFKPARKRKRGTP